MLKKEQDTRNFRSAILLRRRKERVEMQETHPNDYYVFSKMADHLSLIRRSSLRWRLSQIFHPGDVQDVKFP